MSKDGIYFVGLAFATHQNIKLMGQTLRDRGSEWWSGAAIVERHSSYVTYVSRGDGAEGPKGGRTADGPQAETRDRYNDKFYGDAKSPEKEVSRGFHPVHALGAKRI